MLGKGAYIDTAFYLHRAVVAFHFVITGGCSDAGGEDAEDEEAADLVEHFC
jgi:hypothetical protein